MAAGLAGNRGGTTPWPGLAFVANWFDPVSPLDYWEHLTAFGGIDTIARLMVAAGCALAALMARDEVGKPEKSRVDDLL